MIRSTESLQSSREASDYAIHDSCVIRNFPTQKSSHLRFLAWVAYTRKYTDKYITEDERKTCPLLWCRILFDSQEAMLRHVYNCPHLSKGLYWCFHCQKPERVGKSQCKRCQGNPSRTGRMASVAKKIFSKIGAKPHHIDHAATSSSSETCTNPYKDFEAAESSPLSSFQGCFQQDQEIEWSYPDAQELPSTSIIPEIAGDWKAASHELADTCVSEMSDKDSPVELEASVEIWEDNFYAESFEEFDVASNPVKSRGSSPKLARLDTSVGQATISSDWCDTPRSTTIISPMSAIMPCDSTRSAIEISPTDSEASGKPFYPDSGYSGAATQSATFSNGLFERYPSAGNVDDEEGHKKWVDFDVVSEEWRKSTFGSVPLPPSEATTPIQRNIARRAQPTPTAEHSAGSCTGSSKTTLISRPWNDATSLVRFFSEILDSHIDHSKSTLQAISPSPTVQELLSMSRSSIVSEGLDVLAKILAGRHPTSTVQVFSFTHVACALAVAVDDDDLRIHTEKWVQDSLNWASGLHGERHKKGYEQVAKVVWQPPKFSVLNEVLNNSTQSIENSLLATCRHFLDIFEILDSLKPNDLAVSQHLDFAQASFEHKAKSYVVERLISKPRNEAFVKDVISVERRLSQSRISTVRQLELELICAGKRASQLSTAYHRFLNDVTILCDALYAEEPAISRATCHLRDISRIKILMSVEGRGEDIEVPDDFGQETFSDTQKVYYSEDALPLPNVDIDFHQVVEKHTTNTTRELMEFKYDARESLPSGSTHHENLMAGSAVHTVNSSTSVRNASFKFRNNLKAHARPTPYNPRL
ncbi:hypothetical protein QTJ16_002744 [Diplocarpon rosae]|uniref:Uncharacterized protein n=1 Tax=Diplocarpon rosae TaxID=946125 RepID=A0AAD9WFB2_9HELO|nr:hypothetical protein QTJ16_002744 [Diplocarpon rosae]